MFRKLRNIICVITMSLGVLIMGIVTFEQSIQASCISRFNLLNSGISSVRRASFLSKSMDYKDHLVFNGKGIYLYKSPNDSVDPYSAPTSEDHLYDNRLDGLYPVWSKPAYYFNGHYQYRGHRVINRNAAQALGLEQVPFQIYKSFHGEQFYGKHFYKIHSYGISGWVDPKGIYEYDGRYLNEILPITYNSNSTRRRAYQLVNKYTPRTINPHINSRRYVHNRTKINKKHASHTKRTGSYYARKVRRMYKRSRHAKRRTRYYRYHHSHHHIKHSKRY